MNELNPYIGEIRSVLKMMTKKRKEPHELIIYNESLMKDARDLTKVASLAGVVADWWSSISDGRDLQCEEGEWRCGAGEMATQILSRT